MVDSAENYKFDLGVKGLSGQPAQYTSYGCLWVSQCNTDNLKMELKKCERSEK